MLSPAPSSVGIRLAACKHTSFTNIPISTCKEVFFVSGWFYRGCGCFGLFLVLFFYPKYFHWKLVPGCGDSNKKKNNFFFLISRLKFNHSHLQILFLCWLYLIVYQQDVFITRNLIFFLTLLHYTRQGFINPSVMWALCVINCMCFSLSSLFFFKHKTTTDWIILNEGIKVLLIPYCYWNNFPVRPRTVFAFFHSCAMWSAHTSWSTSNTEICSPPQLFLSNKPTTYSRIACYWLQMTFHHSLLRVQSHFYY